MNTSIYHHDIQQSLIILNSGGVILYPTDTVWGLGCDATNPKAIDRIYKIKKRASKQNLLVLVANVEMLSSCVHQVPDVAFQFLYLTEKPMSIIYPKAKNLPENLIADDGSIGIRLVKERFCQDLINEFGRPIVSTSANISGEATPGIFADISDTIRKSVDYIVQWRQDDNREATASTILKVTEKETIHMIRR